MVPDAELLTKNDTTGYAVAKQVININTKQASLSFYRTMEATSEYDFNIEDDNTEYGVYINWGIFAGHADQGQESVRGMKVVDDV